MIAVFIHLDDSDVANGCLAVYPGSHRLGPQTDCSSDPRWHHLDQVCMSAALLAEPGSLGLPLENRHGSLLVPIRAIYIFLPAR